MILRPMHSKVTSRPRWIVSGLLTIRPKPAIRPSIYLDECLALFSLVEAACFARRWREADKLRFISAWRSGASQKFQRHLLSIKCQCVYIFASNVAKEERSVGRVKTHPQANPSSVLEPFKVSNPFNFASLYGDPNHIVLFK